MRSLALLAIVATTLGGVSVTRDDVPARVVLPDAAIAGLMGGGAGVASTNVSLPQNFATATITNPGTGVAWNRAGNRCQFDASLYGASYVGYNANAANIAVVNGLGLPAPNFDIYGDGRLVARTTATYNASLSNATFSVYSASLATKCIGGSRNNQMCFGNAFCPGGACRTCDQAGSCNSGVNVADGPCVKSCNGGSRHNLPCVFHADCTGGGACGQYWYGSACFAMSQCGAFQIPYTDCRQSGAGATANASGTNKFFHSVLSRVQVGAYDLSRSENVYAMVQATDVTDPLTQCSALCNGGPDYCVTLSGITYCAKDCG